MSFNYLLINLCNFALNKLYVANLQITHSFLMHNSKKCTNKFVIQEASTVIINSRYYTDATCSSFFFFFFG